MLAPHLAILNPSGDAVTLTIHRLAATTPIGWHEHADYLHTDPATGEALQQWILPNELGYVDHAEDLLHEAGWGTLGWRGSGRSYQLSPSLPSASVMAAELVGDERPPWRAPLYLLADIPEPPAPIDEGTDIFDLLNSDRH